MKNVVVAFGGSSVEHDVSVITGVLTLNSIDKTKFNAVPLYIDFDGTWYTGKLNDLDSYKNLNKNKLQKVTFISGDNSFYLIKGKKVKKLFSISALINCLHGERGEDGSLTGIANMCNFPIVGSPLGPSSISMDKKLSKFVLKGLKVPVIPFITVSELEIANEITLPFDYPVIIKPECGGSSIGIRKAFDKRELNYGIKNALRYGKKAIIEPLLKNFIEINCAAYRQSDGKIIISDCEKPIGKDEVLTFTDKYESGTREFPAKIPETISAKIKKITYKIYDELDFSGPIRIDYFYFEGKVYLNEINSVPGSMAYYLFCKTLHEYTDLLTDFILSAEYTFAKTNNIIKIYRSAILSAGGGKSAKKLVKEKQL